MYKRASHFARNPMCFILILKNFCPQTRRYCRTVCYKYIQIIIIIFFTLASGYGCKNLIIMVDLQVGFLRQFSPRTSQVGVSKPVGTRSAQVGCIFSCASMHSSFVCLPLSALLSIKMHYYYNVLLLFLLLILLILLLSLE